jgi:hypothetical protein
MRIEEEHPDVLQNIEFTVRLAYRDNPQLTNHAVLRIYNAVLDSYAAEQAGREPRPWQPTEFEQELFGDVKDICETRLGRASMENADGQEADFPVVDVPTMMRCLKRLCKSVQTWTKRGGRQGYLEFISHFM